MQPDRLESRFPAGSAIAVCSELVVAKARREVTPEGCELGKALHSAETFYRSCRLSEPPLGRPKHPLRTAEPPQRPLDVCKPHQRARFPRSVACPPDLTQCSLQHGQCTLVAPQDHQGRGFPHRDRRAQLTVSAIQGKIQMPKT